MTDQSNLKLFYSLFSLFFIVLSFELFSFLQDTYDSFDEFFIFCFEYSRGADFFIFSYVLKYLPTNYYLMFEIKPYQPVHQWAALILICQWV